MYDIIGDIHGCSKELILLLEKLDYECDGNPYKNSYAHPEGRLAVFCGDFGDRGPDTPGVLAIVYRMIKDWNGLAVEGNHDNKLMRFLKGNPVKVGKGMQKTVDQLQSDDSPITKDEILSFLKQLPYKLLLDNERLLVCHAGLEEKYHDQNSSKVQAKCLYGVTTGKKDAEGFPIRLPWQDSYIGDKIVVHGHVAVVEPVITGNVYNIDTSCVYGGKLTALRYPELEFVSQPALDTYWIKGQDH
jgi:protein phosphatase